AVTGLRALLREGGLEHDLAGGEGLLAFAVDVDDQLGARLAVVVLAAAHGLDGADDLVADVRERDPVTGGGELVPDICAHLSFLSSSDGLISASIPAAVRAANRGSMQTWLNVLGTGRSSDLASFFARDRAAVLVPPRRTRSCASVASIRGPSGPPARMTAPFGSASSAHTAAMCATSAAVVRRGSGPTTMSRMALASSGWSVISAMSARASAVCVFAWSSTDGLAVSGAAAGWVGAGGRSAVASWPSNGSTGPNGMPCSASSRSSVRATWSMSASVSPPCFNVGTPAGHLAATSPLWPASTSATTRCLSQSTRSDGATAGRAGAASSVINPPRFRHAIVGKQISVAACQPAVRSSSYTLAGP